MKKKILVLGCSHVSGHGFEDSDNGRIISQHVWPSKISRDFDCEVVNLSSPGQGPLYCVEQIQNYPFLESLSAIMVMWPHSARTLQRIVQRDGIENDIGYHHNPVGIQKWDMVITNYFRTCHNWRTNQVNLIAYTGYVRWLANELEIPVWISTTTDEDHDFLLSKNIVLDTPKDWCSYGQLNRFPQLPDGHFGHKAHEAFYQQYIKSWVQEKVSPPLAHGEQVGL